MNKWYVEDRLRELESSLRFAADVFAEIPEKRQRKHNQTKKFKRPTRKKPMK